MNAPVRVEKPGTVYERVNYSLFHVRDPWILTFTLLIFMILKWVNSFLLLRYYNAHDKNWKRDCLKCMCQTINMPIDAYKQNITALLKAHYEKFPVTVKKDKCGLSLILK